MSKPLLSILIPTVVGREDFLNNRFFRHSKDKISCTYKSGYMEIFLSEFEIIISKDNKELSIGEKRELLYKKANGAYSIQVDDDDELAEGAIELILQAIKENPGVDVISFEEYCNMDGKEYRSNHSNSYHDWEGDGNSIFPDGFHFHRTIFFKDVIRTELAKSIPVPKLRWAEDHEWSKLLKPLIQSELHINQPLYRYIHVSSNPQERYGLNQ